MEIKINRGVQFLREQREKSMQVVDVSGNSQRKLEEYIGVKLDDLVVSGNSKVIEDWWNNLYKKREELLWIKKVNNPNYPFKNVVSDYLSGNITKEKITKIYKEVTKDV